MDSPKDDASAAEHLDTAGSAQSASIWPKVTTDYHGALVRLATMRAAGKQYLLFGYVELFPRDIPIPERFTAGETPWAVPNIGDGVTLAASALPMSTADALTWYEAAAHGRVTIPLTASPVEIAAPPFGVEPALGRFCVGDDGSVLSTMAWRTAGSSIGPDGRSGGGGREAWVEHRRPRVACRQCWLRSLRIRGVACKPLPACPRPAALRCRAFHARPETIIAAVRVRWLTDRSGAGSPGRTGVALEALGGLIAKELHALRRSISVRPSAVRRSSSTERTSEPSCSRWLLLLRLLVVVELASDAVDRAVEQIDRRPEQVFEVGFEARVAQSRDQGVEDVGDSARDGVAFGKRSRVRLVVEGTEAIELKLVEDVIGWG